MQENANKKQKNRKTEYIEEREGERMEEKQNRENKKQSIRGEKRIKKSDQIEIKIGELCDFSFIRAFSLF